MVWQTVRTGRQNVTLKAHSHSPTKPISTLYPWCNCVHQVKCKFHSVLDQTVTIYTYLHVQITNFTIKCVNVGFSFDVCGYSCTGYPKPKLTSRATRRSNTAAVKEETWNVQTCETYPDDPHWQISCSVCEYIWSVSIFETLYGYLNCVWTFMFVWIFELCVHIYVTGILLHRLL